MNSRFSFCLVLGTALAAVLAGAGLAAEPSADGLYARFTTSLGEFWCRLEFEKAPRTVANFVSLAEGTRPWLDYQRPGLRQQPFYDGLKFHRVINGFMNQSGSRNGLGTDGPGYQFQDEFHPQLRHNKPGILSMANSGPSSNGSQFFITVEPTPWLDDKHSVFGEVAQGYDVVTNINFRAGTPGGTPKEVVTVEQVRILRKGAAAQAFDPAAVTPPLPAWEGVASRLSLADDKLWLDYPAQPRRVYYVFLGPDLVQWQFQAFPATVTPPLDASGLLGRPRYFFHIIAVGTEP
jgi:cyclophilin family peptidyl-prolyl cis-trans isomerase